MYASMSEAPSELFGAVPDFLPTWFADETLYSWCARYHRLSGNLWAAHTSQQLFDTPGAGFLHDFPSRLAEFVKRSRGLLGSVEHLCLHHTLLSFYAPFRTAKLVSEIITSMSSTTVWDVKFKLAIPTSRVGAKHPLKACDACMAEDSQSCGIAYWHLDHQMPSIWVCPRHEQQTLKVCLDHSKSHNHRQWLLPDDVGSHLWWHPPRLKHSSLEFLVRLGKLTHDFQQQCRFELDIEQLRRTCLMKARSHGCLLESGRVDLVKMRDVFISATDGIVGLPGMEFMAGVAQKDGGFLGSLLRHNRSAKHPLKYLVAICMLFDHWDAFSASYEMVTAASMMGEPITLKLSDSRRQALAAMVRQDGLTVSEAARRLGLSQNRAMYWAEFDQLPYRKRPRLLTEKTTQLLSQSLQAGLSCEDAAANAGVTIDQVRRFRDTHAEVRALWNDVRNVKLRDGYRLRFLERCEANPGATVTFFRTAPCSEFNWLCKHDREWLAHHIPAMWNIH